MTSHKAATVDPQEIPEVVEFVFAKEALDEFKTEHAALFAQLDQLVERYNTTLEQAAKACRARQVSSGPFNLYQFTTKYNAEAFYESVGRNAFLDMGGSIETVPKYTLDRGRFEACIAQNKVAKEVLEAVRTITPSYHAPKPLNTP